MLWVYHTLFPIKLVSILEIYSSDLAIKRRKIYHHAHIQYVSIIDTEGDCGRRPFCFSTTGRNWRVNRQYTNKSEWRLARIVPYLFPCGAMYGNARCPLATDADSHPISSPWWKYKMIMHGIWSSLCFSARP